MKYIMDKKEFLDEINNEKEKAQHEGWVKGVEVCTAYLRGKPILGNRDTVTWKDFVKAVEEAKRNKK